MNRTEIWKVRAAAVAELEDQLNALAQEGYEIFTVLPLGMPEPLSTIPRERRTLEERTSFAVVARKSQG